MVNRYVETQALAFEVETEIDLTDHTALKIFYIPPTSEGLAGTIASVLSVDGTAIAGTVSNSVNQGDKVVLSHGVYAFWSESLDANGDPCVSPASGLVVEKRGTVRT